MAKATCALTLMILISARPSAAREVELRGQRFIVPDGMELVVAAAPPVVERPICVDFDHQGRLYVADSSGSNDNVQKQLKERPHRILRLEDSDGDGRFDRHTVFADNMMFPEGTLWHDGSLYVAAPPSIWKLTDTDADGVADERVEWFEGKTLTGCANDLHGPYLGPDGWIYWCKGAFAEQTYPRPGKEPLVTRAAHIFRRRPEGGPIEPVMTGGMDNPVEVAFTPGGERIFTTTFLQHPRGGRRDGLIHAIYGGVYGKVHGVIDGHPRTGDVMPVLVHLGAAAPCGLARLQSAGLGEGYKNNLLTACFNLHKITRHVLEPKGASFTTRDEDLLVCDDLDFHPTDVIEAADGSVLVVNTGGWYKLCCPTSQLKKPDVLGAIYRLRPVDARRRDDPWGNELDWSAQGGSELAQLLGDPRPAVQKRAQELLSHKGAEAAAAVRIVAGGSSDPATRRRAVWTLCRIDDPSAGLAIREFFDDTDEHVRQAAIHAASVGRDLGAVPRLVQLLRSESAANRRAAAEALGRIGDASAVPALLAAADAGNDRALEHSLTYALIEIADPSQTRAGLTGGNPAAQRAALMALDQMPGGGLGPQQVCPLLASSSAILRETALFIAGGHPEWGASLAGYLRQRLGERDLDASEFERLEDQLTRLARSSAIQELMAEILADEAVDFDIKRSILRAMAQSGLPKTPASWTVRLSGLLDRDDDRLVRAAIQCLAEWPAGSEQDDSLRSLRERLQGVARNQRFEADVRLAALESLHLETKPLDPDFFAFLLDQIPLERPFDLRSRAARVLSRAALTDGQRFALADALETTGPMELDCVLTAFEASHDDQLGFRIADALARNTSVSALRPEKLEALFSQFGLRVAEAAQPLFATITVTMAEKKQRLEELLGVLSEGDIRRGQRVFHGSKAACSQCHSMGYLGGEAGPDLTHIARIRSAADLLEAVMYPNASFVRSYEPVVVVTAAGMTINGFVKDDTEDEIVLTTGAKETRRIAKADIEEILPGKVSVMPAGIHQQLSRQEMLDLIAFLQTAK